MNYLAVGLMSGSSLDGLDIALCSFSVEGGTWTYEIIAAECLPFSFELRNRLENATHLDAKEYLLLHTDFGRYCGEQVVDFLKKKKITEKPDVIGSHGHTTFHIPARRMTHQLGDGAAIATTSRIPVVSDLRSVDVALGGQGAPVVPVGEKLLFDDYRYFMNIGGICNVSVHNEKRIVAFDVCPANRVLNLLASGAGRKFDNRGHMASLGIVNKELLEKLNTLEFYQLSPPKSLANDFGTDVIYPLIKNADLEVRDALATYCEHISVQTRNALMKYKSARREQMLVTGGGAFNDFLISRLRLYLEEINIDIVVPDENLVAYKEALVMALMAVLRLREEPNVFAGVSGAERDSCGGALWSVK